MSTCTSTDQSKTGAAGHHLSAQTTDCRLFVISDGRGLWQAVHTAEFLGIRRSDPTQEAEVHVSEDPMWELSVRDEGRKRGWRWYWNRICEYSSHGGYSVLDASLAIALRNVHINVLIFHIFSENLFFFVAKRYIVTVLELMIFID